MKRIAILSDIHGNSIALSAVLNDIQEAGGADAYYVLGDMAAVGPDPLRTLEMLKNLPGAHFVRGNTERYLVTGTWPVPSNEELAQDTRKIPMYWNIVAGIAWTLGAVTLAGWLPWLADLPLEMRVTLPDDTRFLGVHAAPGSDDGSGINPVTSQETLAEMAKKANADLVCVGHTHWPLEIHAHGVHFFNLGSVSNPVIEGQNASYALLEASEEGYQIRHRSVAYDNEAVIQAVRAVRHPMAEYLIDFQSGKIKPPWLR